MRQAASPHPRAAAHGGLLARVLRVPLPAKLIGANALIVAVALGTLLAHESAGASRGSMVVLALALAAGVVANFVLVRIALRPVRALEDVAERVAGGDFAARFAPSPTTDESIANLGRTLNRLLETVAEDREQMRRLATHAIDSTDKERARIARELHDSTAQTLAALAYQLSAAARDSQDGALAERLDTIRALARDVLEEVRTLSSTVHPRVLDDLGLVAALEWLARQTAARGALDVRVTVPLRANALAAPMSPLVTTTLYWVAQEALGNVERHAAATTVRIALDGGGGMVHLDICDDGAGVEATAPSGGYGLTAMRQRLALVGGRLAITSAPKGGTRVVASVPVGTAGAG